MTFFERNGRVESTHRQKLVFNDEEEEEVVREEEKRRSVKYIAKPRDERKTFTETKVNKCFGLKRIKDMEKGSPSPVSTLS